MMAFSIHTFRQFFTFTMSVGLAMGVLAVAGGGEQKKLQGTWGGERVIIKVNESGADLEFECAIGRISQVLQLDAQSNFDLPGTLTPEGRGPTRDGGDAANKVRYQGHVQDKTMTLTVVSEDQKLGPYTLTRDSEPILRKCR